MRVLAVDPGLSYIGLAISDETGTIANPLMTIKHQSRELDAKTIAEVAKERQVELIIVGCSIDENGQLTFEGRRANRLAAAIRKQTDLPVKLWDEYGSTREAIAARRNMKVKKKFREGHIDHIAATVILQSYLDQWDH